MSVQIKVDFFGYDSEISPKVSQYFTATAGSSSPYSGPDCIRLKVGDDEAVVVRIQDLEIAIAALRQSR